MKKRYKCRKCKAYFILVDRPDMDKDSKPVCNACFKRLLAIDNYQVFKDFSKDL